jgi:hypothetical protein
MGVYPDFQNCRELKSSRDKYFEMLPVVLMTGKFKKIFPLIFSLLQAVI